MPRCQGAECKKQANFGPAGGKAVFCASHKSIEHINVKSKKCKHAGCNTIPCYGKPGSKIAEFCAKHRSTEYVDVLNKKCKHAGCNIHPAYGKPGSKIVEFCAEHRGAEYVDVLNKKCKHAGCNIQPRYGKPGSKTAEFCVEHKSTEHINVLSKRCKHIGCNKIPIYGKPGSKTAEFCSEHKGTEHVNVMNKKCEHAGCTKQPAYGKPGSKTAEFCAEHKGTEYVDVKSRKCKHTGCNKIPSYGKPGSKTAEFCIEHKSTEHIDVINKRCRRTGCAKYPAYGKPGSKTAEFCAEHKNAEYVDVINKKCKHAGCSTGALYGPLFSTKTHCAKHTLPNEYRYNKPRCETKDCKERPTHTDTKTNYPLRCEMHKKAGDLNVVERKCASCGLLQFIREGALCNDCSDYHVKKVHHAKENHIKDVLTAAEIKFIHDKTPIDGCGRQRPDFVIDIGKHVIIVEVDENQHKSYSCDCEQARMVNLFQEYGGLHVTFVRYNPDEYMDNLGVKRKPSESRLVDTIRALMLHQPTDPLTIIYQFYDGDDGYNKIVKLDYENMRAKTVTVAEESKETKTS